MFNYNYIKKMPGLKFLSHSELVLKSDCQPNLSLNSKAFLQISGSNIGSPNIVPNKH